MKYLASALMTMTFFAPFAEASQELSVKPSKNAVKFTSDAPIELIVGHTDKIQGKLLLSDDMDFSKQFSARFSVDLASIDTGIALRNEHMRDNFLETQKFPKAVFEVTKVVGDPQMFLHEEPVKTIAEGSFTVHGVTLKKEIPVTVTLHRGKNFKNSVSFLGTFPIKLADFKVKRPEVVFQKLADTVLVTVNAVARN